MTMQGWLRKIFIWIILISILPFLTGFWVQREYRQLLQILAELNGVEVRTVSYHRGWMSARAMTDVLIPQPDRRGVAAEPLVIHFSQDISHGPFIFGEKGHAWDWHFGIAEIVSTVALSQEEYGHLGDTMKEIAPARLWTRIDLLGNTELTLTGPAFEIDYPADNRHVIWSGVEGAWRFSRGFSRLEGGFRLPNLAFIMDGSEIFKVSDFKLHREMNRTAAGLWVGTLGVQLREGLIHLANQPQIRVRDVDWLTTLSQEAEEMALQWKVHLAALLVDQQLYGPATLESRVEALDSTGLANFYALLKRLRHSEHGLVTDEEIKKTLGEVIRHRPTWTIQTLNMDFPQGFLSIQGRLSLGGEAVHDVQDLAVVARSTEGVIQVRVPKRLAQALLEMQLGFQARRAAEQVATEESVEQIVEPAYIPEKTPPERAAAMLSAQEAAGHLKLKNGIYDFEWTLKAGVLQPVVARD